jgi:WD40 repeat protein
MVCVAVTAMLFPRPGSAEEKPDQLIKNRRSLSGHRSDVTSVTFSPDSRLLVTAEGNGPILVWEIASARMIQRIDEFREYWDVQARFRTKSDHFVAFAIDKIREFEVLPGEAPMFFSKAGPAGAPARYWEYRALAFARDGSLSAFGLSRHARSLIHNSDAPKNAPKKYPPTLAIALRGESLEVDQSVLDFTDRNDISALEFASDNSTLVAAGTRVAGRFRHAADDSGFLLMVDASGKKARLKRTPVYFEDPVFRLAISSSGQIALGMGRESSRGQPARGGVVVLDGADVTKQGTMLSTSEGPVSGLAFSRDGKRLFVASSEKEIRVISIQDRKLAAKLGAHKASVTAMELSADGKWLASGDTDGGLVLWELKQ